MTPAEFWIFLSGAITSTVCFLWVIWQDTRQISALQADNERLRRGDFTEEEFQNLCHGFDEADEQRFKDGCVMYQAKLFGGKQ